MTVSSDLDALAATLGPEALRDEPLANHTAIRVGGPADLLIVCESIADIVKTVKLACSYGVEWRVLGGGCNVLVSDAGVRGLVIVNRAARIEFGFVKDFVKGGKAEKAAWAETGAQMATLARETVGRELAGLEWAAGLPGTVGGAVVGNAGAFEGDIAGVLYSATVLEPDGRVQERPADWFEFEYRLSRVKRESLFSAGGDQGGHVVLAAMFCLQLSDPQALAARMEEILEWRRTRHPSGATMGSTFKNPPDSHAGYLIEQAGLRGHCVRGAQISELHGNFFMNTGHATSADVVALIEHARAEVRQQFGVELELEIELIGRQVG